MNIEYKNNLKNNTMTVVVTLEKRLKRNQPHTIVKWFDVVRLVEENYTPPSSHALGGCSNKFLVADNNNDNQLKVEWVFELLSKPKKKTSSRKK
jgi:hypothetical protein